jgi:hypothetical protein
MNFDLLSKTVEIKNQQQKTINHLKMEQFTEHVTKRFNNPLIYKL